MIIPCRSFICLELGFTRCYLLKGSRGLVLVDTSLSRYFHSFEAELNKMGRDLSEISTLVLTHHHDDHCGFAAEVLRRTNCQIVLHEKAIPYLKLGRSETSARPFNRRVRLLLFLHTLVVGRQMTFSPVVVGEKDLILSGDEDVYLQRIGIDGKILHTPGHFQDCISLVLSNGDALVGDAAMNIPGWTGIRHYPVYLENLGTVRQSWRKLLDAGAFMIYPAHGKPFPASRLEVLLDD